MAPSYAGSLLIQFHTQLYPITPDFAREIGSYLKRIIGLAYAAADPFNASFASSAERLVYNSDFARDNFAQQMAGIFTLGKAEADVLTKIADLKAKHASISDDITRNEGTLGPEDKSSGKRGDLRKLRAELEENCWVYRGRHDVHFKNGMTGSRGNKAAFCDKLLSELSTNTAALVSLDDLKTRALTVFEEGLEKLPSVATIDPADLIALEKTPVLSKKVVGKDDIDIATLIKRLGNSDWVRQGLTYITDKGSQCPFCQQDITDDLYKKLTEYFDETFLLDVAAIEKLQDSYDAYTVTLLAKLNEIIAANSRHIDNQQLQSEIDRLVAKIELNKNQIKRKRAEPSSLVSLDGLEAAFAPIIAQIKAANEAIKSHNDMVDNLEAEKTRLIAEIWKFLLDEASAVLKTYAAAKQALDAAINGLSAGIATKKAQLAVVWSELTELEKNITSVEPTVTEINGILKSFGFNNFSLATAGEHKSQYELVRRDGSEAATTLSEGEKSFLTFLYFYHSIKGSKTASGTTTDRVVVFDDPVSSLDADVLFIVSALIKRILKEAEEGTGLIKQVFVLTHNIYFHKEVTFDPKRGKESRSHETFWIVRKAQDKSTIVGHPNNPIKTSYELLWEEVRKPDRSNLTIQNTLRRILENYFKIMGNIDFDKITEKFDGKDQQICGSLFSWMHDGSHNAHGDLYMAQPESTVHRYLSVFRRIFEVTNHLGHYEMMMGAEALASAARGRAFCQIT